jgi:hypothetical protein
MAVSVLGTFMTGITLCLAVQKASLDRGFWHLLGIAAALVPFVWFSFCYFQGWVAPRDFLVRVME